MPEYTEKGFFRPYYTGRPKIHARKRECKCTGPTKALAASAGLWSFLSYFTKQHIFGIIVHKEPDMIQKSSLSFFVSFLFCLPFYTTAQTTIQILDTDDSSAISYCRVWNESKTILYHADKDGKHIFSNPKPGQVFILESLAHEAIRLHLDSIAPNQQVFLAPKEYSLQTVVVTPDKAPLTEYWGEEAAKGKKKAFNWGGFISTRYTLPENSSFLLKKVKFYIRDYSKDSLMLRLSVNPVAERGRAKYPDVSINLMDTAILIPLIKKKAWYEIEVNRPVANEAGRAFFVSLEMLMEDTGDTIVKNKKDVVFLLNPDRKDMPSVSRTSRIIQIDNGYVYPYMWATSSSGNLVMGIEVQYYKD
jgi:hypothetical protein